MRKKPTNRQILFAPPGSAFRENFPILPVTIFRKRKQPSPGCQNTLLVELKNSATEIIRPSVLASEEACAIPFPGFAKQPRKLHICRLPLPFPIEPTSLGFDGDPVKAASRSRHSPEPDVHGRGLCWWAADYTLRPALPFAGRSCAWSGASRRFSHTRAHTAHRAAGS